MKKIPKLRFKGFEEEWESTRMEELFEIRNGYTPSKAVKQYWEGGTIPWFRMEDIRENGGILADAIQHITPLGVKGAGLFEKNSIILATTATIGVHAMLIADSLANQQFTNFSIRKSLADKYDSKFVYYAFFGIDEWAKKNTNSGGLLAVNMPLLLKQPFYAPSLPEQQRIASYFTHLDTLIEASRQKVEKYKQVKAASLQALFPQHGERVPKLRFKGCEGEWKKISFEEVFDFLKNNSLSRAELSDEGSVMNVHYGDVLIKYPEFLDVTQEKMTYVKDSLLADKLYKSCPLQDGDVVIADAAEDETVGKCTELVNVNSAPIVSGLHTIPVRPRFSFASKYLGFFLNSNLFHNQLLVHIQGSKISSISRSAILKTFVYFPSLQEQHLIAQYFTNLDSLLTLEQQRYEKLQQVKRASLSQMFV